MIYYNIIVRFINISLFTCMDNKYAQRSEYEFTVLRSKFLETF
jgi:hypothetical protein